MRTLLFSTASAMVASVLTWLMVHPIPADAPSVRPGKVVLAAGLGAASPAPNEAAPDRWPAQRAIHGKIPAASMQAIIQAILQEGNPVLAMEAFSALLRELTPENAGAAWSAMSTLSRKGEGFRYLPLLAHAWGSLDGAAALAGILASGDTKGGGKDKLKAQSHAMSGWAAKDPAAALAWIRDREKLNGSLTEGKEDATRDLALLKSSLIRGLATADPAQAMAMLASFNEKERAPMAGLIAREQYRLGMDAAAQWAGSLTDATLRDHAMASLLREYAGEDPAKAAAWLTTQSGLQGNAEALTAVARGWAAGDPAAAVKWITTLPEGPARDAAWQDVMRTWNRRDPLASSNWLAQMPAGSSRDAAVSSLTRSIARSDPDAAIQWAQSIQDPTERETALVRSVQLWSSKDQAAAAAWMQSSGVLPEVQQRMLEPLPAREGRKQGPGSAPKERKRKR